MMIPRLCFDCGHVFQWDGYAPVLCDACLGDEESSSSPSLSSESSLSSNDYSEYEDDDESTSTSISSSDESSSSPITQSKPPAKPLKRARVPPRYPPVLPTKTTRKFHPE
jgi:hypothetical protein